ncbi:maker746 [Drosophila busckii]|uniref:Maker746 n=1 Tax=Drosophila busckii TaxID=30019 RepID=A0A0M5J436_DROBS|nr:maker746 [Drosophila busckii]
MCLKKCCCFTLRTGSIVASFYTVLLSLVNVITFVDHLLFLRTNSFALWTKWFNIAHAVIMLMSGITLLISILFRIRLLAIVWFVLFIVHMLAYYLLFNVVLHTKKINPYAEQRTTFAIYIVAMVVTFALDIYAWLIVWSFFWLGPHKPK